MIDLHKPGRARILLVASALGLASAVPLSPASAQVPFVFEYAAIVVCGKLSPESDILAGGRYYTAVNVHNPGRTAAL